MFPGGTRRIIVGIYIEPVRTDATNIIDQFQSTIVLTPTQKDRARIQRHTMFHIWCRRPQYRMIRIIGHEACTKQERTYRHIARPTREAKDVYQDYQVEAHKVEVLARPYSKVNESMSVDE